MTTALRFRGGNASRFTDLVTGNAGFLDGVPETGNLGGWWREAQKCEKRRDSRKPSLQGTGRTFTKETVRPAGSTDSSVEVGDPKWWSISKYSIP